MRKGIVLGRTLVIFGIIVALSIIGLIGSNSVNAELDNIEIDYAKSTLGPIPPENYDKGLKSSFGQTVISGVPAYVWRHGCGPTAAGMVIGFYDGHGYCNLVPGDASTQTNAVNQMIASGGDHWFHPPFGPGPVSPWACGTYGHYEDYSWPEDSSPVIQTDDYLSGVRCPVRAAHSSNCLADFMRTSWSNHPWGGLVYGWSYLGDVDASLSSYVNWATSYGITTTELTWGALTWSNYKAEIDANRPVVFLVDTNGDGHTDHFVTGIGYDDTAVEYGCYNTWDHNIHWYDFTQMSSGNPWGIHGATFCQLSGGDSTPPTTTKTVGWPQYMGGDYVTTWTPITLSATDNPGGCGVKHTYYRIWYNGLWTLWMEYTGSFTLSGECKHYIEFFSVDNANNVENKMNQTHYVDDTPPTTYVDHIGHGYYMDPSSGLEYIKCGYEILLYAIDGGLCQSGVLEIWYNYGTGWYVHSGTNVTFTMPDEECVHLLQYFAVDNLINVEWLKEKVYHIDCTPPTITKTHPDPCYYPINQTAGIIKVGGRIILEAEDGGTPPCISLVEDIYYGFTFNGKWYPEHPFDEYCGNYNITKYKDDKWWYTYTMPIRFHEECKHVLEYWTKDNVCNTGPTHEQTYWVNKCQNTVYIDDGFGFFTLGWWHTHYRNKQMALDWLGPWGTAYVYDGVYQGDISIDNVPCCDNTGITQMGEYGCFPISESAVIKGSETIKVPYVKIKYLEYTPNINGAIIVEPNIYGTYLRCNKFRRDCVANAIGVNAQSGSTVNARLNWWGAPDGPDGGIMDDGKTADGLGVKIFGDVFVEPWIGIHAEISKPTSTPLEVEVGTPVTFDATGSWAYTYGECCIEPKELPLQYLWDFDDGKQSSNKITSHVFEQTGTYQVSLMVDAPGIPGLYSNFMYDWAYITIHVVTEQTPLTCNADGGNLGGYKTIVNEPLQLYGDAYGGKQEYSWHWNFGDQTMDSTEQNPVHTYTEPGTYTATLTVVSGGETATDAVQIVVYDIDELFVTINDANTIAGTETMFAASINGGTPPYTVSWDFGDGVTSQETNPTHIYNSPGVYTITVIVTDDKQKTAIDTATITVEEETNVKIIEIKDVKGGLGIKAVIAAGDNNCAWEIIVEGTVFFGGENSGVINANTQETVRLGFSLAIGNVDIKLRAEDIEKQYTAFALGPIYINLQET